MSDFKIEKNIPLPNNHKRSSWPFELMIVGDSFAVNSEQWSRAVTAASWYGRRHNKKFSVRQNDGAYRCWRIA